jgi:hypothetical protein
VVKSSESQVFGKEETYGREDMQKSGITIRLLLLTFIIAIVASLVELGSSANGAGWISHVDSLVVPSKLGFFIVIVLSFVVYKMTSLSKFIKLDLSRAELLAIYSTTAFMFAISGMQFVWGLIAAPARIAFEHYLSPNANWYIKFLSPLLYPSSEEALMGIMIGNASVPWREWIVPLCMWFLIYGAMYFLMYVIACLFYHRWNDHERLTFPLVAPILVVTDGIGGKGSSRYSLKNTVFLLGLLVPIAIWTLRILNFYFPAIPADANFGDHHAPDYLNWELGRFFGGDLSTILSAYPGTWFRIWPFAVGIGYLVPTDFSFSMAFFYYIYQRLIVNGILYSAGIPIHHTYANVQFISGSVGLLVLFVWVGKNTVKQYIVSAFKKEYDMVSMPMSPKILVGGTLVSLAILFTMGYAFLSVSVGWMLVHVILLLSSALAYARCRAESGLPMVSGSPFSYRMIESVLGSNMISPGNRVGLRFISGHTIRGLPPTAGSIMEAFRFADEGNMSRRSMLKLLGLAFVMVFAVSAVFTLRTLYSVGLYIGMGQEARAVAYGPTSSEAVAVLYPLVGILLPVILGFVLTVVFGVLRNSYVWWPFHPMGFLFAQQVDTSFRFPGPFLIAWVIKTITLRYGGREVFERIKPFFIGLIIADVGMEIVMVIVKTIALVA